MVLADRLRAIIWGWDDATVAYLRTSIQVTKQDDGTRFGNLWLETPLPSEAWRERLYTKLMEGLDVP